MFFPGKLDSRSTETIYAMLNLRCNENIINLSVMNFVLVSYIAIRNGKLMLR